MSFFFHEKYLWCFHESLEPQSVSEDTGREQTMLTLHFWQGMIPHCIHAVKKARKKKLLDIVIPRHADYLGSEPP